MRPQGSLAGFTMHGYYPGLIGQVASLHAVYYAEHWGLDASFEAQVATELAAFVQNFNPERGMLRAACTTGGLAGFAALDADPNSEEGPRLRWFIVDPIHQGKGLGWSLLAEALAWARAQGLADVHLWTFQGLESARRLYLRAGFALAEEKPAEQWGRRLVEQKYVLDLA